MTTQQLFAPTRTEICGIPVSDLAQKFGTPSYIYDAETIRQRIEQLRQFDVIRFAQKANSNIAVLDLMRRHGVVVDAVSTGEVHRAQRAGFELHGSPHPVVYTADIFDREALELVVEHNIPVNCGSPDMIRQLGQAAPGREITLRINPGFGHGHSAKTNTGGDTSKHGIWYEQLDDCVALAKENGLTVAGLHMHIGSGTDFEHLSQVCDAMRQTALKVGSTITAISAGGGLPTPYRNSDEGVDIGRYFKLWDAVRKDLEAEFGHDVALEIEPGRFLVAECGYLLTEIRAVKHMGEKLYYLLDAGFNNLARPILYGSYHPMSIAFTGEPSEKLQEAIVGGPLCESGDIFTQEEGGFVCARELPVANVGDYLVIECAGAYGFVMASNYNSKPLSAEVLIDNGTAHLIRKRQTPEDIVAGETIPS